MFDSGSGMEWGSPMKAAGGVQARRAAAAAAVAAAAEAAAKVRFSCRCSLGFGRTNIVPIGKPDLH